MMLEWSVEFVVRPWLRPGRRDARVRGLRAARVHAHTGRHRDASCDGCGSAREGRGLVWQPLGSARHFSIWGFSENLRRIMRFSLQHIPFLRRQFVNYAITARVFHSRFQFSRRATADRNIAKGLISAASGADGFTPASISHAVEI